MSGQQERARDVINMSSQAVTRSSGPRPDLYRYLPSRTSLFIFIYIVGAALMNGGLTPFKRGFFCNDTSIQYPVKTDTVSFRMLLVISLFVPWLVIRTLENKLNQVIDDNSSRPRSRSTQYDIDNLPRAAAEGEGLMAADERVKRRLVINEDDEDISEAEMCDNGCDNKGGDSLNESIAGESNRVGFKMTSKRSNSRRPLSDVHVFLFGIATTSFLTGIGKMTCGRYRPHFMQRCQPDVDCSLPSNMYRYIEVFKCTNQTMRPRDYSYITTSWPSGHASIVFYSMLFLIYYMDTVIPLIMHSKRYKRLQSKFSPLILHCIYTLMIGLATYVSLTRVSDYHHHPLDVLSGIVIGAIVAYAFADYVFKPMIKLVLPK